MLDLGLENVVERLVELQKIKTEVDAEIKALTEEYMASIEANVNVGKKTYRNSNGNEVTIQERVTPAMTDGATLDDVRALSDAYTEVKEVLNSKIIKAQYSKDAGLRNLVELKTTKSLRTKAAK